ncbi:MAG: DUF756 domain-containing protein, partial [Acidobacteriota bacterium]|nr:DUF756 domain-containing protein [Acidobacteriota bacterium]
RRAGREIRETNIGAWRRAMCGDLTSVFRPFDPGAPGLSPLRRDEFFGEIGRAQFRPAPAASQSTARQEPGTRLSCALPYNLAADGALSADGKAFELTLEARGAAGAPFHVYTPGNYRGGAALRTRAYAVAAGERLTDSWDLEGFDNRAWHIRVCGPNGFLREFQGSADDPRISTRVEQRPDGSIEIAVVNSDERPLTVRVSDESYGASPRTIALAPGARDSIQLDLGRSHNWYDFTIAIDGSAAFHRRCAGRVETGKDGVSDPAIGRGPFSGSAG